MKIKKKGTSGNAKNFITRTQAVKKLQVSLADFRRLCIFKGIYPREPRNKKKANKGSTAPVTFYYAKDIQYLLHEPILVKFREHKTFAKKLQRALGRGEVNDAQRLESNRPKMKLNHVIKERYPTFLDALRDLDDPLNMLFLFSTMPATDKVSHRVTKDAEKLSNQWLAYVSKEKLLRKVFVSIKGVYYEALVKGQEVRWLVPFKFPTNIPSDVDFRIMLTFLEFYSTLLHFTLFKLYSDANLIYPPTIETEKLKGIGGLSSFVLQTKEQGANALLPSKVKEDENSTEEGKTLDQEELNKALKADEQVTDDANNASDVEVEESNNAELDDFHQENSKSDSLLQPSRFGSPTASLFSNLIFYVGREVALDVLEFCVLSCGGSLISEIALDDLKVNQPEEYEKLDLSNVTHQIVDRPKITQKVPGRTYLQPQWIFDCINKGELIPVNEYAPGEPLPPHLSPWGDAGAYDPQAVTKSNAEETKEEVEEKDKDEEEEEQEEENDDEEEGTQEEEDKDEEEEEEEEEEEDEEEEEEDEDLKAQKELEMESAGVKFSDLPEAKGSKKSKKRSSNAIEDEEKELKKIMMTNKQRKLYNKMQYGIDKKRAREEELTKKKKKLDKAKKQLNKK